MTIVVAFKVGDGVVLGADSASTMWTADGEYQNSYFNAEKLFHLVKNLPIGIVTFGLGGLQNRSISSLITDLRRRIDGAEPGSEWHIDQNNYQVSDVAQLVRNYFYDELYARQFSGEEKAPNLGFYVAGYSSDSSSAEVWRLIFQDGICDDPAPLITQEQPYNVIWDGQPEAIRRLVLGFSWDAVENLKQAGIEQDVAVQILTINTPIIHGAMPIQDAIDFVHYLIDVTCGYVRFCAGQATVAHPIDSAAITKHNGFKWIRRKHYYSEDLNPRN